MTATTPGTIPAGAGIGDRTPAWVTDALLVLMAVIWGINFSVLKYGTTLVSPLAFNGMRVPIAAVTQLAVARGMGLPRPAPADVRRLLLLGMLGNGLYQICFILGVAVSRVATAALVVAATPAFIAIIGWLRRSERLAGRSWVGIACQVLGVAVVVTGSASGGGGGSDSLTGAALLLVGALSWAMYSVLLKGLSDRVSPLQIGGYTMVGGASVLLVVASPALLTTRWAEVPPSLWPALLYSAIIAMVFAYLFWYRGLRVLGPTRTAVYANVQPLIAMLVAWLALREVPTPWQVLGATMIVGGLLLTRLVKLPAAPAE
jgi:drug/metabolite transporter (DMT)-like permease